MSKPPIIVIGYLGNMGKRYTTILDKLNYPWIGIENMGAHYDRQMGEFISGLHAIAYHSVIIATPTYTHMDIIKRYRTLNLPVLCEKPISKSADDIDYLVNNNINITMINQYKNLSGKGGATYYNFYNSGGDGIEWDCINIVGLAGQERAYISNESLTWDCCINGKKLELNDVNQAYVDMIKDWIESPGSDLEYIKEAHKRVREGYFEEGTYRHTSKVNKPKAAKKDTDDATGQKDSPAESGGSLPKERGIRKRQKQ